MNERYRILLVCTANYCRSPSAQGLLQRLVDEAGLGDWVELDSAGTHPYRIGEPPDPNAIKAASERTVDIKHLRARLIADRDFERFDLILGMDRDNFEHLHRLCPRELRQKLRMFMDFAPHRAQREVPDPFGAPYGRFEKVFDLLEDASRGLVAELSQRFGNVRGA